MPLSAAPGFKQRILIDTATPFDASSINLEIDSENITINEEIITPDGLRGVRTRFGTRATRGRFGVSGTIVLCVTPAALAIFLPAALGAAVSSEVYNVADALPVLQILTDNGDQIRHLENVYVNTIEVVSEPGQPMKMTLNFEAEDINEAQSWPGSPPAIADDVIFIHSSHANASLGALSMAHHRFSWTVNNFLTVDEWANSTTRAGRLIAQDREVSGSVEIDAISENAVAIAGSLTEELSVVATAGTYTLTIAFGLAQAPKIKPTTTGKTQRHVTYDFIARSKATGDNEPDIRVTLDAA